MALADSPSPDPKPSDKGEPSNQWIPGLGGLIFSGLAGYAGQKETNETNVELGREQMKFQERMSNSAYQRAVEDMKKAGINPMLVTQVGGANSPSGAMPQVQNAIGAGIASAQQGASIVNELQKIDQTEAATEQLRATTEKVKSETMDKDINSAIRLEDLRQARHTTRYKQAGANRETYRDIEEDIKLQKGVRDKIYETEMAARGSEARQIQFEEARRQAENQFWESDLGKSMPWLRSVIELVRGSHSAYSAIKPR